MSVEERQAGWKVFGFADDGESGGAEDVGEVGAAFAVDGDAEGLQTQATGFVDGHAEHHKWTDARTERRVRKNQLILHNETSPNNADLRWLQERATSRNSGAVASEN